MRILLLHAHPDPLSYCAALRLAAVEALQRAGHAIDVCDLYAEGFASNLTREERACYHDPAVNRRPVQPYVDRLLAAEGLVLVFPVWNFGYPAILKGFFDRVFLPGVSFRIVEGKVESDLDNIRKLASIATYGGPRWRAFLMGDPPRRSVTRALRAQIRPWAPVKYLALYDMNRATRARREGFLRRVRAHMGRF